MKKTGLFFGSAIIAVFLAPEQSWSKEYNLIELEQQFSDEIANNNKTQ